MRKCLTRKSNGMNNNSEEKFLNHPKSFSKGNYLFKLLALCFKTDKLGLFLQLFIVLIINTLPIIVSYLWKIILNIVSNSFNIYQMDLIIIFILYAVVGSISASCLFFIEFIDSKYRNNMSVNFQKRIFDKSKKIPLINYEIPILQDYITRSQDTFSYGTAIGTALSLTYLLSLASTFVISLIFLYNIHYILAILFVLIFIPYIIQFLISKITVNLALENDSSKRNATTYMSYAYKYDKVKEVKFFDLGKYFIEKWSKTIEKIKKKEIKVLYRITFLESIMDISDLIVYILIIYCCGQLVINKQINIADFGATFILIGTVKTNAKNLIEIASSIFEDIVKIEQGFKYLDLKEQENGDEKITSPIETIRCENICFKYPLTTNEVIHSVNAEFKKNEITVVVGKNGMGKTTLSKLLLGLFKADKGTVYYNNIPIENIDFNKLHKQTTVVFQDFCKYFMTVQENVGISDINNIENKDKSHNILNQIYTDNFIDTLPNGVDTLLGKEFGGTEISGGEWQYLAICRAYFKDSSFVVLDEPSSALDPLIESKIYQSFKKLCHNKIGIIITHRLAVAVNADKILVIDNGTIVESGTHNELIKLNGIYADMYISQAGLYE